MYEKFYLEFTIFWTAMGVILLHMQIMGLKDGTTYFYRIIRKDIGPKRYWAVHLLWFILSLGCFSLIIDWILFY